MSEPTVMRVSRAVPLAVCDAFDAVLPMPLPQLFVHRHGPIPPIAAVEDQDGVWAEPGQTRTIRLAGLRGRPGGGSMREELLRVDRPQSFAYVLTGITGPLKPLADHIDGLWSFDAVGTGTRVSWQWTVHPRSAVSGAALPVFAKLWHGFATRALEQLETLLLPA